ncbi:uncharacterized protein TRAVEDRAFT_50795 [Trametes versicolor FP-101664 SS1]|uniref:uncharacterized protein n=1 Tax=Trametes versicolor (strain FP-101664) TaxID=717944 RepID=UPI0004624165|nr:uncharacterized protein TRAVEDRAFT_50795 [Trametes versicolor FP-101664 SS1]EIW54656.1 hypothetical protein TRAVEDRAFT_50795 [Trametes versicolor FP-101664 SS1]
MSSSAAYAASQAQRKLMHIEQSVEDISDLFLSVYLVLDNVGPENCRSHPAMISLATWDQYYQDFLRIASLCRRNLHESVAVMDAVAAAYRETVLTAIGLSSYQDTMTGLQFAENLMRKKVACGTSSVDDLKKLAGNIRTLQAQADHAPTGTLPRPLTTSHWNLGEVIHYISELRLQIYAMIFFNRHLRRVCRLIGRLYSAGLVIAWKTMLRIARILPNIELRAYPGRSTPSGESNDVPLVVSEPGPSYPDTMKYTLERVADDITKFALTWSEISDEIAQWAAYLKRRAASVDSEILDVSDLTFYGEIAGMWDAIMSMRHASLRRMHPSQSSISEEL